MNISQPAYKRLSKYLSLDAPTIISRAPGRINLIGEHTDYNHGFVLPAAISRSMYFAIRPNETSSIKVHAIDINEEVTVDLHDLKKSGYLWADFLIGNIIQFQKRMDTKDMIGFDCVFTSEVPMGSGMSSSSALECAFICGLNHLFKTKYGAWDLITMSQRSNHEFLGIKGGILDQFSSFFGKQNQVMMLNCDTQEYNYYTLPESEYTWLLVNTNVKHNHLVSGYNDRVAECKAAVENIQSIHPSVNHLSAVKSLEVLNKVNFDNQEVANRARFIITENQRVHNFVAAMSAGNYQECGELLYRSHDGLSQLYEVSCPELDFLVDLTRDDKNILGSRMMGGGFGGCTINLIHHAYIDTFRKHAYVAYTQKFDISPSFYEVEIGDGAEVMN